jgi:hypothetical protein
VTQPARTTFEPASREKLRRSDRHPQRTLALRVLRSPGLIYVLAGLGMLLRIAQYASNRSLWHDEALLALNLIDKRWPDLAGRLDFDQAAPVGFLFTEKLASTVFGPSEYALRLFPLVCGLLSILAFVWLARRTLPRGAVPLAVLLFVVADALVYYSSELKPYETDVAAGLGMVVVGVLVTQDVARLRGTRALALAIAGFGVLAFSFAAVFVVAAVAATLATLLAIRGRRTFSVAPALIVLSWAAALVGIVTLAVANVQPVRESFGSGSFLGIPGESSLPHAVNVMGTHIAGGIGLPQDRPFNHIDKLALLCAIVGAVSLLRRKPTHFSMLVLPFTLLLGASALHEYPILPRTLLFLIPAVLLFIAAGVHQLVNWMPTRVQLVVAPLLAGVLAAGPIWSAGEHLLRPRTHEEIRPVLEFVRDHWRHGDTIYVHNASQYAMLYYEECKCLRLSLPHSRRSLWPLKPVQEAASRYSQAAIPLTSDVILGRRFANATAAPYIKDVSRVEGRGRVWFLYSHLSSEEEQRLIQSMLRRLNSLGVRIKGVDRPGAHAYLYRLRGSN